MTNPLVAKLRLLGNAVKETESGEEMENFPASLRVIFLFYRLTPFPHSHPPLRVGESFVQTVSSQVGCASDRKSGSVC